MKKHNVAIAFILLLIGLLCLILVPLHTVDRKGRVEYLIKVNPRTFPYLMSLLMTILSAGNLIFTLLRNRKTSNENPSNNLKLKEYLPVIIIFIVFLLYAVLLNPLGYVISTALLCVFMALYFKAKIWQVLSIGIVVPVVLFLLFTRIGVPLPRGFIGF